MERVPNTPSSRLPCSEFRRQEEGRVEQRFLDGRQERVSGHRLPGDRLVVCRYVRRHAYRLCQVQVP